MTEIGDITQAIRELTEALDRFHGKEVLVLVFDGTDGNRRFEVREGDE